MHNELRRTVEEKESLELKFGDYAQTLSRYEEAMALKEQEKSELVQSYNGLNSEAERLTATVQDMEGSLSEARSDLLALSRVWGGAGGARGGLERSSLPPPFRLILTVSLGLKGCLPAGEATGGRGDEATVM